MPSYLFECSFQMIHKYNRNGLNIFPIIKEILIYLSCIFLTQFANHIYKMKAFIELRKIKCQFLGVPLWNLTLLITLYYIARCSIRNTIKVSMLYYQPCIVFSHNYLFKTGLAVCWQCLNLLVQIECLPEHSTIP